MVKPERSRVAPALRVIVPVPKHVALPAFNVPPLITVPPVYVLLVPDNTNVPVPSFTTPTAPAPVPVLSVMLLDIVKSEGLFDVSKPIDEPLLNPLLLMVVRRFVNNVDTLDVVNSFVPPTLIANVAPVLTTIFVLTQFDVVLLYSEDTVANLVIPPLSVVLPVYVFAADNTSVPTPSFVTAPVLVAIGLCTKILPAPPNVKPNVPVNVPALLRVRVSASELILDAAVCV
jgi:hypothetical protein